MIRQPWPQVCAHSGSLEQAIRRRPSAVVVHSFPASAMKPWASSRQVRVPAMRAMADAKPGLVLDRRALTN